MKNDMTKLVASVVLACLMAGCTEESPTLRVGSKPFSESMILAEMIAQMAENEGIAVERSIPYGVTQKILEAVKQDVIDVYPEYNGTGLIFLGQAPTSDGEASTETITRLFKPLGLEPAAKFGFANDYAIVMTAERAKELGISSIGDLAASGSPMSFAVDDDFTQRPADGLQQMLRRYGMTAGGVQTFPVGTEGKDKIVSALLDGSADVAELFMTDGQIAEYNLVVLEDDLEFFPVYDVMPLVRSQALSDIPGLKGVLDKLAGAVSAADMQQMNKSVDLDAQTPASVASAFLSAKGLLPEGAAGAEVETLMVAADPGVGRSSKTARALRAVRVGFPGKDLELLNALDPLAAIEDGSARVAMVGTESFYAVDETGPRRKANASAFAVLGYRSAHLLGKAGSGPGSIAEMSTITTGAEGTGSAIVLDMVLRSLGLSDKVQVTHSDAPLDGLAAALAAGETDGAFIMAPQDDRAVRDLISTGQVQLLGLDEWAAGGHTARYSFIRPATFPAGTYPGQSGATATVSTQYVLASPTAKQQATGDVGPGTAGVASAVPVPDKSVKAIVAALAAGEIVDPAVPVHASLVPSIEVVDKSLPFSLDVSIINILTILFVLWAIYSCALPSPRDTKMPDDD